MAWSTKQRDDEARGKAESLAAEIRDELARRGYVVSAHNKSRTGISFCVAEKHEVTAEVSWYSISGYSRYTYDSPRLRVHRFSDYRHPAAGAINQRSWSKYKSASDLVDRLEKHYSDCEVVAKRIDACRAKADSWDAEYARASEFADSLGVGQSLTREYRSDRAKLVGLTADEAIACLSALADVRRRATANA